MEAAARSHRKGADLSNRVLSAALIVCAIVSLGQPVYGQSAPVAAKAQAAAVKAEAAEKREAARLLLDPHLFTPDDRWVYDGSDKYDRPKARFGGAIVGQRGTVSIGDTRWLNTGAFVLYQVWKYPTLKEARQAFRGATTFEKPGKFARRTTRQLKAGDEARDVAETVVNERGEPTAFTRRVRVRFGSYVLAITSSADMKAFGPAPSSGSRPWLSEAVFNRVLQVALQRVASLAKDGRPAK